MGRLYNEHVADAETGRCVNCGHVISIGQMCVPTNCPTGSVLPTKTELGQLWRECPRPEWLPE